MSGKLTTNHDLDAADTGPSTLGGWSNQHGKSGKMTQREFKRRLDDYCRKKGIEKLTLGGGPAKTVAPSVQNSDAWGNL